jgi:hypothetical protein
MLHVCAEAEDRIDFVAKFDLPDSKPREYDAWPVLSRKERA